MSSLNRSLSGDVLIFRFDREVAEMDRQKSERQGPIARTLLKNDSLRVTLIVLEAGGSISEHSADGPITVQPLKGSLRFIAADKEHLLSTGELLSLNAGVRHAVHSDTGATFLLTISLPPRED